jgi:hypothetical protein
VYPNEQIASFITDHFLPVRVHVREDAAEYGRLSERFGAEWTPTILILDPQGTERHRIEGFLPVDDFLAQLEFGLGRLDFSAGHFDDAEGRFRHIVDEHPNSDVAPEALYWAGVSKYKETDDGAALKETAEAFASRYQETPWAKKASVWG